MNCRSKVELTVCHTTSLILLCLIAVVLAVIGWFRDLDPSIYQTSLIRSKNLNVTSVVHTHSRVFPHLDDIGSPPLLNHPHLYRQWTILHMNDVYELKPFDGGKRGGLARVGTIRKLLLRENPNTITIIAGDIVSPSALGRIE